MKKNSRRTAIWGGVLLILLVSNLVIHWPKHPKETAKGNAPEMPGTPGDPPPEMKAQLEEALQKLPEDQRAAVTQRMSDDRAFADSVKDLPTQERQQKIQEHFAENPPPQIPGMPSPLNGGSGANGGAGSAPGSWGGPQSGHIPPPEVRYGFDQQIANSQKNH
jgi:hypothetical protein